MSNAQFTTTTEDFESYRREMIPKGAPNLQVVESRRAFFAGAASILLDLDKIGELNSPEVAAQILQTMRNEVMEFQSEVKAGRA